MTAKRLGLWHLGFCSEDESQQLAQLLPDWYLSPAHLPLTSPSQLHNTPMAAGVVCLSSALTLRQINLLGETLQQNTQLPWIALVDNEALHDQAIRQLVGEFTFGYQVLPVDANALNHSLRHASAIFELRRRTRDTRTVPRASGPSDGTQLIGDSRAMRNVRHLIGRAAAVEAPVLITGESGTGKELVARELHQKSRRGDGPFVAVNCGAIPGGLIQSELFGHEKGAFTNASDRQIGRVESAHGGCLFLDEIGELPPEQQVSFLRFLQDGVIQRVGGRRNIEIDLRILAATNVDLESAIAEQNFREDIYYRINVLHIHMPPLRERDDDCLLLAQQFLQEHQHQRAHPLRFSPQAQDAIRQHPWPGNVRELKNRVFKAAVMSEQPTITAADLELDSPTDYLPCPPTLTRAREQAEADSIRASLRYTRNNVTEASRLLQVSRPTLYRLMARHNIAQPSTDSGKRLAHSSRSHSKLL